jgi:hypothetical protein
LRLSESLSKNWRRPSKPLRKTTKEWRKTTKEPRKRTNGSEKETMKQMCNSRLRMLLSEMFAGLTKMHSKLIVTILGIRQLKARVFESCRGW